MKTILTNWNYVALALVLVVLPLRIWWEELNR